MSDPSLAGLTVELLESIGALPAADWNAVTGMDYPFIRHEFLAALEASGAVSAQRGWRPRHVLVRQGAQLVAVMPMYEKAHSYGEYVFDWAWADAYHRHGLAYYPKWLAAIPFTPATGPRLCTAPGWDRAAIAAWLLPRLRDQAAQHGISSIHLLFPDEAEARELAVDGFMLRTGPQYHWFNQGYQDFDDFLACFNSRKRKALRRERRRVTEQGLTLDTLTGDDITPAIWEQFYRFYQLTYAKRSGHGGYLDQSFFTRVGATLPASIVLMLARHQGRIVAGALNFRGADTLYGRYWGCQEEFDALHFEACYYQGIDYCIRHGLARFDPGAQGEHKIQRGFEPIKTYSRHWLAHPGFQAAVGEYLQQEQAGIDAYLAEARQLLPFRRSEPPT